MGNEMVFMLDFVLFIVHFWLVAEPIGEGAGTK